MISDKMIVEDDGMEELVRIIHIEINGIKNVCHGEIYFNDYNSILKGNFNNLKSVLGIYGPNGSGKTTVLELTKILKDILTGKKLKKTIGYFINNQTDTANISYTFFIQTKSSKLLLTYNFIIGKIDDIYQICYEKLSSKEFSEDKQKWLPKVTLMECENKEVTLKKIQSKITKESLIELRVAQEIDQGASFIFHDRNRKILLEQLKSKDAENKLIDVLNILPTYAETKLIIIENDVMGSINLNTLVPINIYLDSQNHLAYGGIPINLTNPNVIPETIFNDLKIVIKQIDIVLNSIIPSINLEITNIKEQHLKDGSPGISFEVVSLRNKKFIPLKYESEGIKRLISVISSMIAAYNNPSICLMIDEFDSDIFEYLLGELVEIIDESAKGQFVFTSHNLRALEKLSYKSIIVTTSNPKNRYIQLAGVKSNNNVRDYYYKNIVLGGQSESIYEETKNYKIKRAFRKAGSLNE